MSSVELKPGKMSTQLLVSDIQSAMGLSYNVAV